LTTQILRVISDHSFSKTSYLSEGLKEKKLKGGEVIVKEQFLHVNLIVGPD
jgi:hypothetical protein